MIIHNKKLSSLGLGRFGSGQGVVRPAWERKQLGAFGGEWEDWCDAKFGPNGGVPDPKLLESCRWNGFPCNLSPPWTDVGSACRGIPKPALLSQLLSIGRPPNINEFDPVNLITLPFRDPARFAALTPWAMIYTLPFGAGIGGATYMAQFVFPQAIAIGFPLAVGIALSRGGVDGLWTGILEPMVAHGGLMAETALNYAFNGNSALVKYAIRQQAKAFTGPVRVVMDALADMSGDVLDAIKNPETMTEQWVISKFGTHIQTIADILVKAGTSAQDGLVVAIRMVGEALVTFSAPISILLKRRLEGVPDAVKAAIKSVFNIDVDNIASAAPTADTGRVEMLGALLNFINSIAKALAEARFEPLSKAFEAIISPFQQMFVQVQNKVAEAEHAAAPVTSSASGPAPTVMQLAPVAATQMSMASRVELLMAARSQGTAVAVSKPAVVPVVQTAVPMNPPTQPAAPKPPGGVGVALAGAGAGFVVGGPVGAVAGAAAGFLLSRK